jgi:hypothetical protein
MKALFDADILVFRAGFAAERQQWFLAYDRDERNADGSAKEFDGFKECETYAYKREAQARLDEVLPGIHSRIEGEDYQMWSERYLEPLENALHNVKVMVNKCLEAVGCTEFDAKFYLSGKKKNFRYAVAKTRPYKGNRKDKHRPQHEDDIRKYIRATYDTDVTDGIEADDALGIAQTVTYGPQDSVIISIDKDLDMIPGRKYNFVQEIDYDISDDQAWHNFCHQLLTGDSTDNIPGLPRVGAATATKALDGLDREEYLAEVARRYASKSGKEDWFTYLQEQADLLWIMREPDVTGRLLITEDLQDFGGDNYEEMKDAVLF